MKTSEYYKSIGYEDHGYISPELSSADTYPDYIKNEVSQSVSDILKHQGYNTVTFAFITDIHYALTFNHEIRMKRTVNAYKEIAKRVHIDKLILGGDYTNEGCKEYKTKCYNELRAQLSGIDYFPVNGNHDDGTIWDIAYIKSDKSTNHLTHEELYTLFYNHIDEKGAVYDRNNRSLYYYIDDKVKKVRYICLDSSDVPYIYNDGQLMYNGQWIYSISEKQLKWLVNDALKFDEEGWSTALFVHTVALPSGDRQNLGEIPSEDKLTVKETRVTMPALNDIIDAYKEGKHCQTDYNIKNFEIHIDVDFSKRIRADVIGVFVGDYHIDKVEKTKSGVPYILTANSVTYYNGSPESVKRCDGDKTEMLFDVVTVNKDTKEIFITRVGAGENRNIKY